MAESPLTVLRHLVDLLRWTLPKAPRTASQQVIWGIALLGGIASLWRITEQDIFWQVRAGDEILHTWRVQQTETWSYTSRGQPWLNPQWLSTVVLRAVYALGGEVHGSDALIAFRGFIVALLLALAGRIVLRLVHGPRAALVAATLVPLVFVSTAFRLQMRPDLFLFVVFAGLIDLWLAADLDPITKRLGSIVLVALAANLHAGTALFVLCTAGAFVVTATERRDRRQALGWLAALVCAFFLTPYGARVLPFIVSVIDYGAHNRLPNPDQQPLALRHFDPQQFALGGLGVLCLWTCAVLGYVWLRLRHGTEALPATHRVAPVAVVVVVGLTALGANRIRALPYLVLYVLAVVAAAANKLADRPRGRHAVTTAAIATWLCAVPAHALLFRLPWGFGVNPTSFPIGTVAFMDKVRPKPRIYHGFTYGHYLTWHLRDYEVFADTRETPYWHLQDLVLAAYQSPDVTQRIYEQYGINAVLAPIPATRYLPGLGFEDVTLSYNPPQEWATVYFDHIAVLMIRRIPEHQPTIEDHEYRLLKPNLPPSAYVHGSRRTPELDARFERELSTCRKDEPDNAHCRIAQSAWWRATGHPGQAEEARRLLETLPEDYVRKAERLDYLLELAAIYGDLKLVDRVAEIEQRIEAEFGKGQVLPR